MPAQGRSGNKDLPGFWPKDYGGSSTGDVCILGKVAGNISLGEAGRGCRILVLPSSTIQFWLREVRRSFMFKVKIVQVYRYSVRILVRFLFVVSSSGGNASE
jgi:hypothetical protein